MNKITMFITVGLLLIGCTDYSSQVDAEYEEWREKQLAIAVDSIAATMTPDTVTIKKVDTLKTTVRDTVIMNKTKVQTDTVVVNKTKYDTVTVKDTVMKVDTLVKRDTVVKTKTVYDTVVVNDSIRDTIVTTVIDTIHVSHADTLLLYSPNLLTNTTAAIDTTVPRDTTIVLTLDTNGVKLARIFNGKIYKGVFYDTTLYRYPGTFRGDVITGSNPKYQYVYRTQCGALSPPDYDGIAYLYRIDPNCSNCSIEVQNRYWIRGWHEFNEKDMSILGDNRKYVIPKDSTIFLSRIDQNLNNVGNWYGASVGKGTKWYMCAYDLN